MDIDKIDVYIRRCIHSEEPVIDDCGNWVAITTKTWYPDLYSLGSLEEMGLIYHGEIDGAYLFKTIETVEDEGTKAMSNKDYRDQLRDVIAAYNSLKEENDRAVKVLTKFGDLVCKTMDQEADLDFKCDQGSESREFEHGTYCGRTAFANELYKILMEEES